MFFFHFEEKVLSGKPVLKESVWLIVMEPREHSFPQLSLKVTLGSISFDAEHLVTVLQTEKSLPLSQLSFGSSCTHTHTDTHMVWSWVLCCCFFVFLIHYQPYCVSTLCERHPSMNIFEEKKSINLLTRA